MPPAAPPPSLFHCLIRTHHITSRKKLHRVRRAAAQLDIDHVLVRSGGCPGIMFASSRDEQRLGEWVSAVQALRYKDFRCVAKPAPVTTGTHAAVAPADERGFHETESMNEFGRVMAEKGLGEWFKKIMFT